MSKKKEQSNNEVTVLEDIIFNQNEKMRKLEDQIKSLKEQLELAYGVNEGLIEEQDNEEKSHNLTRLQILLMIIMGLSQRYCDDSDYGRGIGTAIENFYCDAALNLVKFVNFGLGNKPNEDEDNEGTDEEWDEDNE